jgi:hypothetical protein
MIRNDDQLSSPLNAHVKHSSSLPQVIAPIASLFSLTYFKHATVGLFLHYSYPTPSPLMTSTRRWGCVVPRTLSFAEAICSEGVDRLLDLASEGRGCERVEVRVAEGGRESWRRGGWVSCDQLRCGADDTEEELANGGMVNCGEFHKAWSYADLGMFQDVV